MRVSVALVNNVLLYRLFDFITLLSCLRLWIPIVLEVAKSGAESGTAFLLEVIISRRLAEVRTVLVLHSRGSRADLPTVLFRASILVKVLLLHSPLTLVHLVYVSMLSLRIASLSLVDWRFLSKDATVRHDLRCTKDRLARGLPGFAFLCDDLRRCSPSPLSRDTLMDDVKLALHGPFVIGCEKRRQVVK